MAPPVCPKCGYRRRAGDDHVLPGVCPACGIAMAKWAARQRETAAEETGQRPAKPESGSAGLWGFLLRDPPQAPDAVVFWGRAAVWALLLVWGWGFILAGMDWRWIGSSFLHSVDLVLHEAGHVFFMPFGTLLMFLGGSLFQILLPLAIGAAFLWRQQERFGASVCLWWGGQSCVDVAPYIADARTRYLPLISGNEANHDWYNILSRLDMLTWDQTLARLLQGCGWLLMLTAMLWGGWLLWRQWRLLRTGDQVGL